MEILEIHHRNQLDPGDGNCHNFEFTAPPHDACSRNHNQIISYSEIQEGSGLSTWTCPECGALFEVYVPLNSDLDE
jgi:hypothetical protein